MKVLKPGRQQKGWSIEIKCSGSGNGNGGCGAFLLVEQDDLFQTSSSCRDETDYYTTFRCPQCGVLTDLPRGKVPDTVTSVLPSHTTWVEAHPFDPKRKP